MKQSSPIVDFESLLKPISDERPTGIDLREDDSPTSIYFELKDARTTARADERNQAGLPEIERTLSKQWDIILTLAPRILQEQSKDLEVAAWYTEALLRKHGMAGLRDGFLLLNELVALYWNNLYPQDDIETKLAPLAGLFGLNNPGTLAQPINCIPVTDPKQTPSYAAWQYTQASNLGRAPDAKTRNKRIKDGTPTLELLEAAAKKTRDDFYTTLWDDLEATKQAFQDLFAKLEEYAPEDVPNSSFIRGALNNITSCLKAIAKTALNKKTTISTGDETVSNEEENLEPMSLSATPVFNITGDTSQQRAQAFETIQAIAEFFRKTEPHSPISYALERVIRWGGMELPALLQELLEDRMAFDAYCKLTGVQAPQQANTNFVPNAPMGYHDPMMGQAPHQQMGMGMGGYPPQPSNPMGGPMGGPMYNDTF